MHFLYLLYWVFIAALVLLEAVPASAAMVLPMDLREMTDQSGRIFVGHCGDVSQELDENGMPVTYIRLTVTEGIRGVETGETVLIKQFGQFGQFGAVRTPRNVGEGESAVIPMKTMAVGSGGYEPGHRYLLFLYPESGLGFTSPVGSGQGRFPVSGGEGEGEGEGSALTVMNPLGNQFLKAFSAGPVELPVMIRKVRDYLRSEE